MLIDLPIYKLIPTENGTSQIAILDDPAIETYFYAFSSENDDNKVEFKFSSDEQKIVYGPVLIPDKLIRRKAKDGRPEHYVTFDAEGIRLAAEYFFKKNLKFNSEHDVNKQIDSTVIQSYFTKDENNEWGVPAGSWIIEARINNDEQWKQIKETEMGFSYEGSFVCQPVSKENDKTKIKTKKDMKFREKFESEVIKFIKNLYPTDEEEQIEEIEEVKPIVEPEVEVEPIVEPEVKPEDVVVEEEEKLEVEPIVETGKTETQPVQYLTKEDVQGMFEEFKTEMKKINEKVEQFGNEVKPMALIKIDDEDEEVAGYKKWKKDTKKI